MALPSERVRVGVVTLWNRVREMIRCWVFASLFFAAFNSATVFSQSTRQPNIVLLLADDLGYGEIETDINKRDEAAFERIPTPHIDSIAANGVRFTQGYVTGPNCSPSRAGLLTGKIPTRFGYEFNPIGARNEAVGIGLPAQEITLGEMLQERGYTTGIMGKWHLGGSADFHPFRHGFDEFFGFTHEGHYFVPPPYEGVMTMLRRRVLPGGRAGRWVGDRMIYSTHMGHNEPDYDANNPIVRGGQPHAENEYLTDSLTRESRSFIKRHADKPFFLYVAYNAVHSPLQSKLEDYARFPNIDDPHRRIFAGMLASLDDSVGEILTEIQSSGIERKTLVIFLSDNGGPTRELTSSNRPLRGEKGQMYEGAIRVPFRMCWPGVLPEGKVYEKPVLSADLFATAATLAGAKLQHEIDGVDLLPFLSGESAGRPHRTLFWRQGVRSAVRVDDWKLVRDRGGSRKKPGPWQLYDLSTDLSESNNLSAERPEKLQAMIQEWKTLNNEMVDPLF
ncbi:MAG: sulfatase-like hydrolase/transferase [Planctomycetota bacterium]